jgi:hypothetical protein
MSAPDDDKNPWLSLYDLLLGKNSILVGVLATSIEEEGIQSYDRFGRRLSSKDQSPESPGVKEEALDLLAQYYREICRSDSDILDFEREFAGCEEHSMMLFGWPKDEAPDFGGYESETIPKRATSSRALDVEPNIRVRRSYLLLIYALIKKAGMDLEMNGLPGKIAKITQQFDSRLDAETIRKILKDIPDAIEARRK